MKGKRLAMLIGLSVMVSFGPTMGRAGAQDLWTSTSAVGFGNLVTGWTRWASVRACNRTNSDAEVTGTWLSAPEGGADAGPFRVDPPSQSIVHGECGDFYVWFEPQHIGAYRDGLFFEMITLEGQIEQASATAWGTGVRDQPFTPGPWSQVEGPYNEDGDAPWFVVPASAGRVLHVRTASLGTTPRAKVIFREYGRDADGIYRAAGPWSEIEGGYNENLRGAPWFLVAVGDGRLLHVRTDNIGATPRAQVKFREYARGMDGVYRVAGPWSEIAGAYNETLGGEPWFLSAAGEGRLLHVRTDNIGSTPRAKVMFREYARGLDGVYRVAGPWSEISGAYSEDRGAAPWALSFVGEGRLLHVRTDNIGATPRAKVMFREYARGLDGVYRVAGPWSEIAGRYNEDLGPAPWSLLPRAQGRLVHIRTDRIGSTRQAKAMLREYVRGADGVYREVGPWSEFESQYSENIGVAPWSVVPTSDGRLLHVRTDNVGVTPRAVVIFREYVNPN